MNDIINKFLLRGGKFMSEMHLRQPGFSYIVPFTKNKKRIQKFRQTGDSNELDKGCFRDDMAYGDFKDLAKRMATDKFLKNKAFKHLILLKIQNMMDIQVD